MLVLDNRDVSIWGDQQFNEIKLFLPLQQTHKSINRMTYRQTHHLPLFTNNIQWALTARRDAT